MDTSAIATLTVMRGELERLPGLLQDLEWARERHLVETGPTPEPLKAFPRVQVHHHPLPLGAAFDAARMEALPHLKAPWVLVVDTDERLPPSLIEHLAVSIPRWEREGVESVWLPRRNHVLGTPLLHSSAWPDYQLRFMRREVASFSNRIHGFAPTGQAKEERLPAMDALAIQHFNFESTLDFVTKLNVYSGIEAEQAKDGAAGSIPRALYKAGREFAARYVKMRGWKDGAEGLHFALMLGVYRYLIESKRWEAGRGERRPR